MFCVTGRTERNESQVSDRYLFRIPRDIEISRFNREDLSPELLHLISIDSSCAGNQFFGVQEMGCAYGMNIDLGTLTRQPALPTGDPTVPLAANTAKRVLFFAPHGPGFLRLTVTDSRGAADSVTVRVQ